MAVLQVRFAPAFERFLPIAIIYIANKGIDPIKTAAKAPDSARRTPTARAMTALLDRLGRRYALRIVWELREGRRLNFRDLAKASGSSPSVLNRRLAEMRKFRIVELGDGGYALTKRGADLARRLSPLYLWAGARTK